VAVIADRYLPAWVDVVRVDPRTFVPTLLPTHPASNLRDPGAVLALKDVPEGEIDALLAAFQQPGGDVIASGSWDTHRQLAPPSLALQIATIAHAAIGQRRRDAGGKEYPVAYIVHPVHVAALAVEWSRRIGYPDDVLAVFAAAVLHDVLEDTKLTADDLVALGLSADVVDYVVRLTKVNNDGPEDADYFLRCCARFPSWIVKAADTTSNLMSFAADCLPNERNQGAKNYAAGKRAKMLPVYENHRPEGVDMLQRDYVLDHVLTALRACEAAASA